MPLAKDLLDQAFLLAALEPRKPKQASLRRSVSTAYYALFHLLVEENSRLVVSGYAAPALRSLVQRAHVHAEMKKAAAQFVAGEGGLPQHLRPLLAHVSADLRLVGQRFVDLQQARHRADYDSEHVLTRREATRYCRLVKEAFEAWERVRKTPEARVFLLNMLLGSKFERRGDA